MALLPCLHLRVLMGGIVVANEMDLLVRGSAPGNESQELQPFLVAMPLHATADDPAIGYIHRRKERGGAVALVVMRQRFGLAPA